MEAANPHNSQRPAATSGPGELILQNGRQAGARRALGVPTTFLGRQDGCDIRLNVDGVAPMHCVLVASPDGLHVRDLNSAHGTCVNGERVESAWLRHGDVLNVGPFQFRVELTPASATPAAPMAEPSEHTREALRIQAAAVAAQQIALEEEEARLELRRQNLEHQEEQLAAHLAEKQRHVQIWTQYTASERDALHKEKLEHEKQRALQTQELLKAQQEVSDGQQKNLRERQRIDTVYQRLRTRWRRHGEAERQRHHRQTLKLQAESQTLQERQATLTAQEAAHAQDVLCLNTERELFTRQMRDEHDRLNDQQQTWRRRRSQEHAALKAKELSVAEAQANLQKAGTLLAREKANWDQQHDALQKELHGLNNRIVHQRMRIQQQEEELARLDDAVRERRSQADEPEPIECEVEELADDPAADAPAGQHRMAELDRLAGELVDQRVHLIEQYARLGQIQDAWQRQRDQAAAELDCLAQRLAAEEDALSQRDRQTILIEDSLRERQEEINAARQDLQVWRAQWKSHEATFTHEHQTQMAALRQKETLLQEQLADLVALRQRWNQRRQQEIEQQRTTRTLLEQQQRDTHQLRAELFDKTQQLESEKRVLAEKALALEQYRQEVFFRANDPASQRRVERLRRRWLTLNATVIRTAKIEREAVQKALLALEALRAEMQEQTNQRMVADTSLAEKQAALDEREAILKARQLHLEHELKCLEQRAPERRTREQVEILAQMMYENDTPIEKAA
jgi:pSer/pThr/pTyr-binding forkhead associated (FHA) protein